jgi:hypothetical protein
MPRAEFEPSTPATDLPQTYALDRAATGIGQMLKYTKPIILLVLCIGVKLKSLTLREEHRLRVFENRVLRRIFGPKKDEVTNRRKEDVVQ